MRSSVASSVREFFTQRAYPARRQRVLILLCGALLVGSSLPSLMISVGEDASSINHYASGAHLLLGCGLILGAISDFFLDRATVVTVALRVLASLTFVGFIVLYELSGIFSPGVFVAICAVVGTIAYAVNQARRRTDREER